MESPENRQRRLDQEFQTSVAQTHAELRRMMAEAFPDPPPALAPIIVFVFLPLE
jgi:hypothetical protein